MAKPFKPMKGEKVTKDNEHKILWPKLGSIKFDGIRFEKVYGEVLTASSKPLQNRWTADFIREYLPEGSDGELLLRGPHTFQDIQSAFMSRDGKPDFEIHVFDLCNQGNMPFQDRLGYLQQCDVFKHYRDQVKLVDHVYLPSLKDMHLWGQRVVSGDWDGKCHEGWMLRDPYLPYKFGDASINQQHLLKCKPLEESDAIILEVLEGETNNNPEYIDEQGHTARSSARAGMIPSGTLGKLRVINKEFGEFFIGIFDGVDDPAAQEIFNNRHNYRGKLTQFRFQRIGTADKPRQPVHMHFRDPSTLSAEKFAELWKCFEEANK